MPAPMCLLSPYHTQSPPSDLLPIPSTTSEKCIIHHASCSPPLCWHPHTLIGGFWEKEDFYCCTSHIQLSKKLSQGNSTFALECRLGILNCFQEHKTLLCGRNGWNRKVILITHTAPTATHLLLRPVTAPAARRCLQVESCPGLGWLSVVCGRAWEPLAWIHYECGQGNSLTQRKLSPSTQLPGSHYKW